MKGAGLLRKLQCSFTTLKSAFYKSFIRTHLDYGDLIYDQPSNATFSSKIESIQYTAALAIIGAISGSSREKLYQSTYITGVG